MFFQHSTRRIPVCELRALLFPQKKTIVSRRKVPRHISRFPIVVRGKLPFAREEIDALRSMQGFMRLGQRRGHVRLDLSLR
jgi:hypothetical protein